MLFPISWGFPNKTLLVASIHFGNSLDERINFLSKAICVCPYINAHYLSKPIVLRNLYAAYEQPYAMFLK